MIQTHETGISPLDWGPAFQGTGADVEIMPVEFHLNVYFFWGSILLFLELYYK